MAKIFICDSCGAQFPQPLDEEKFVDEHGVLCSYDLCAPCRKKLKTEAAKPSNEFFKKIEEKKKNFK